jgi:hypothetical protein
MPFNVSGFTAMLPQETVPSLTIIPERTAAVSQPLPGKTPQKEIIGPAQLRKSREVNFQWDPVPGASAYEFILFAESNSGRRRIFSTGPQEESSCTLDMAEVGRGDFSLQAEALIKNSRLNMGEKRFTVNVPLPNNPTPLETGVLYGISE